VADDTLWAAVDDHLEGLFGPADAALDDALARSDDAGLPRIAVSPMLGRLLQVLALARGARRILELGTLGGYSTIWLARALPPGGRLVSLEAEPRHAEVARVNIAAAGVDDVVEIRVGAALDTLAELEREGTAPFDLVFIDADKPPYTEYLQAALRLSAPGTLIIADNVVRGGRIADPTIEDPAVAGVQRFNAALAAEPRVTGTVLQLVGTKGYDGMALAVVR
jgi:predicted O-methyltransferase YrrM